MSASSEPKLKPKYFVSLSLAGVRSFGAKSQMVRFGDGDRRPSQWTVILGENGTGKSTILEALAAFDAAEWGSEGIVPRGVTWPSSRRPMQRRTGAAGCEIRADVCNASRFGARRDAREDARRDVDADLSIDLHLEDGRFMWTATDADDVEPERLPVCYAYGAARRGGRSSLSPDEEDDPTASLFDPNVDLLNPEEWFLRTELGALRGRSRARSTLR